MGLPKREVLINQLQGCREVILDSGMEKTRADSFCQTGDID
jgi:hypothetical protein